MFVDDTTGRAGERFRARRSKFKQRRAKRMEKRKATSPAERAEKAAKTATIMMEGGEAVDFSAGQLILYPGTEVMEIQEGAVSILIVGPAAAVDEASQRLEFADLPGEVLPETTGDYMTQMVAEGDITAGGSNAHEVCGAFAMADGIGYARLQGMRMNDAATVITGIVPAILIAIKTLGPAVMKKIGQGIVSRLKRSEKIGEEDTKDGFVEKFRDRDGKKFSLLRRKKGGDVIAVSEEEGHPQPQPTAPPVYVVPYPVPQPVATGAVTIPSVDSPPTMTRMEAIWIQ